MAPRSTRQCNSRPDIFPHTATVKGHHLPVSIPKNGLSRLLLAALAATATLSIAAPAQATKTWKTCRPGTKEYIGAYRGFDNAWRGPSSTRFCVKSTGRNITIDSNAQARGGNVVAYPSIRFGAFFTDRDPQSRMP